MKIAISITDSEFVFSLTYLACNAHVLYCHLWPVWLYDIFPHYLTNGMIFWKNIVEHNICVVIFHTTFVCNISHAKKKWVRYYHKFTYIIM